MIDGDAQRLVELAEALTRAGAVAPMTQELARRIDRGIVLEDAQHRTVASAGTHDGESGGAEHRKTVPIGTEIDPAGWLTAIGPDARNGELDLDLAMRVAAVAFASHLKGTGSGGRAGFWSRLHAGEHRDVPSARDDAGGSGVTLRGAYVAVAFEYDTSATPDERRTVRDAIARAFHFEDPSVGAIDDAGTTIVFVPAEREVDASNVRAGAELLARETAKRKPPLALWGGIGTVEPPVRIRESADRARAALSIARRVFTEPRVAAYDALGAYPLLYFGADDRTLQAYARGVLAPLRAYDESHQTELERTLRVYFETGENLKVAAAHLNVHRHTVLYRLRQIGEICGRSLENHHDQLALRVAIAVDALHSA